VFVEAALEVVVVVRGERFLHLGGVSDIEALHDVRVQFLVVVALPESVRLHIFVLFQVSFVFGDNVVIDVLVFLGSKEGLEHCFL